MPSFIKKIILATSFLSISLFAVAEETHITVRVLAKDAKFIGSSMEGAEISLVDTGSGKTLAKGLTQGKTGNTTVIMKSPKQRHKPLSDEGSAAFNTKLNLSRPTKVKVIARGPMNLGDNASEVSAEIWMIPGKHLNQGDAILLEMPGFYVISKLESPVSVDQPVKVVTNVRMMCGCPIEPKGLWDANRYEMTAILLKNGKELSRKALNFVKTSEFSVEFPGLGKGSYEIVTFAYDPSNSNTGVDTISFKL